VIARRAFVAGAALTLLGCEAAKGCDDPSAPDMPATGDDGTIPADPGAPAPPAGGRVTAPSPIGYSNVATLHAAEVRMMGEAGLTLCQAEITPFDTAPNLGLHLPRLRAAVAMARTYGMTTLLTVVNWNGRAQRAMGDAAYLAMLDTLAREIGPASVWLEGVSEPDRSAQAVRWQRWAVERWPGTSVVNGPGGRGAAPVRGDILDVHPCSVPAAMDSISRTDGRVTIMDCTPVLASHLSQADVQRLTEHALSRRANFLHYDTSNAPAANPQVIQWMREALAA
jgi:hypothetical protein